MSGTDQPSECIATDQHVCGEKITNCQQKDQYRRRVVDCLVKLGINGSLSRNSFSFVFHAHRPGVDADSNGKKEKESEVSRTLGLARFIVNLCSNCIYDGVD